MNWNQPFFFVFCLFCFFLFQHSHLSPSLFHRALNTFSCQALMWGDYSDALELAEVIYKLCHHISGLGVLKLYAPRPLESSTWPPVIPSVLNLRCYMGDLMWPVEVNWRESACILFFFSFYCRQLQTNEPPPKTTWVFQDIQNLPRGIMRWIQTCCFSSSWEYILNIPLSCLVWVNIRGL